MDLGYYSFIGFMLGLIFMFMFWEDTEKFRFKLTKVSKVSKDYQEPKVKIENEIDYIVIDGKEIRQFNLTRKLDKEYDELVNVLLDKADSFKLHHKINGDYYGILINIKKESFSIWIENKYYSYGTRLWNMGKNKKEEILFEEKGISISTVKRIHDIEMDLRSKLPIEKTVNNYKRVMDLIK